MNGIGMRASYNGDSSNPNLNVGNTSLNRSLDNLDTSKKNEIEAASIRVIFYVNIAKKKECVLSFQAFDINGTSAIGEYKYSTNKSYKFEATLPSNADYMMIKIDSLLDCQKILLFNKKHIVYNLEEKMITTDELNIPPYGTYPLVKYNFNYYS